MHPRDSIDGGAKCDDVKITPMPIEGLNNKLTEEDILDAETPILNVDDFCTNPLECTWRATGCRAMPDDDWGMWLTWEGQYDREYILKSMSAVRFTVRLKILREAMVSSHQGNKVSALYTNPLYHKKNNFAQQSRIL